MQSAPRIKNIIYKLVTAIFLSSLVGLLLFVSIPSKTRSIALDKPAHPLFYNDFNKFILYPPPVVTRNRSFYPQTIKNKPYLGYPLISNEQRLLFCWIPKNGCTQIKKLFCKRYARKDYPQPTDPDYNLKSSAFAHGNCTVPQYRPDDKKMEKRIWSSNSAWHRWATIRDPLDRLISGWLNKCIHMWRPILNGCFGCGADLDCFIKKNYQFLRKYSNKGIWDIPKKQTNMTVADHFMPQSWFCGFHERFHQYTKLFVMTKDDGYRTSMTKKLLSIGWPAQEISTGWGTHGTDEFMIKSRSKSTWNTPYSISNVTAEAVYELFQFDEDMTETFLRTYWADYTKFSALVQLPSFIDELCLKCGMKCENWLLCARKLKKH